MAISNRLLDEISTWPIVPVPSTLYHGCLGNPSGAATVPVASGLKSGFLGSMGEAESLRPYEGRRGSNFGVVPILRKQPLNGKTAYEAISKKGVIKYVIGSFDLWRAYDGFKQNF